MQKNQHNDAPRTHNSFDFLRLCAAFSVLFAHHFNLTGTHAPQIFGVVTGHWGVITFFALSGYLVMGSYFNDPHLGRFLARRALRIFPGLIACVVVTVFLMGPWVSSLDARDYFSHPLTWLYLKNMMLDIQFLLPGVFANNPYFNSVNGSLWTIPWEFKFYLALGGVSWLLGQYRKRALPAILLLGILYIAVRNWQETLSTVEQFALVFLIGMLMQAVPQIIGANTPMHRNLRIAVLLLTLWLVQTHIVLLMATWAALMIIIGKSVEIPFPGWLRTRDISYGVYLYAFPIQQVVYSMGWHQEFYWPTFMLVVFITTAFAVVSCLLIEQPALRFKPKAS